MVVFNTRKKGVCVMHTVTKVLSGIGILIGIYLILSNGHETSKLINSVMSSATNGIKVLQGRG